MPGLADFDDAVLGQALPPGVEAALKEAAGLRGDLGPEQAALMRARQLAPEHPAVLIALYRSHFYGHRLREARDVAAVALEVGARPLGLPARWRDVPREPLPGARHEAATRFWLFSLKGLAYLSLRLGELDEAADALDVLRALDPQDHVGAALLETVRQRALRPEPSDDEYGEAAAHAHAIDGASTAAAGRASAWAPPL